MNVLMLAPWMKMGHGVSEMVARLEPELNALGIHTAVGCLGHDEQFAHLDLHLVTGSPADVDDLVARTDADAVVALGTPFFEVLPRLAAPVRTIAYEAGDPTPELFADDAGERRAIAAHKRENVYPHVDAVAAISDFIRSDIGWPSTRVIALGIDNVPDLGCKPTAPPPVPQVLRVGALSRLGSGEARYKGVAELVALKDELERLDVPATFEIMGRGTPKDAAIFRDQGFTVHLNASEERRNAYLREVDVFVSTSLWEGTNLPLVEAQAQGTPGLALDTGAHPEFTPLLFSSLRGLAEQLRAYEQDRDLLDRHGRMCYHFVRSQMVWASTARSLATLLEGAPIRPGQAVPSSPPPRDRRGLDSLVRSLRHEGARATARKAWRAVAHRR